jgi:hypothetical protein
MIFKSSVINAYQSFLTQGSIQSIISGLKELKLVPLFYQVQ